MVVRALLARGERSAALEALLAAYGAEVFGLIIAVVDKRRVADLVYADVLARAVIGLDDLDPRAPVRLWLYGLARRALRSHRERIAENATTHSDELRPVVAAVRRGLGQEDRELLILRIDRALDWEQLAQVELGDGASSTEIDSVAASLESRFEGLVERMREMVAHQRGRRR